MENLNRRGAMSAATAGAVAAGALFLGGPAAAAEPQAPKLWTLEGELKVHPKFIYRYYLYFGDGQICALYGADHAREPEQLARLKLPARIQVRGALGTEYHPGDTKENRSPFPRTWTLYMDVHEVGSYQPFTRAPNRARMSNPREADMNDTGGFWHNKGNHRPNPIAFGYTNGSWFCLESTRLENGKLLWKLAQGEPYLRTTFKGTTAELNQVLADHLAGKGKLPEPVKAEPGFGTPAEEMTSGAHHRN